ncbi:hypothetical protein F5884DRAFT_117541 [Xylogone sp. PMI_703]|nr:hypothetical protein F5884DRAFT_117541 [Xylogone sp. PMI_703]
MMLNTAILASIDDDDVGSMCPRASWVFQGGKDSLRWLTLQMGLKPLLMATKMYHEKSVLQPIFRSSDEDDITSAEGGELGQVPETWARVTSAGEPHTGAFHDPVRMLAKIRLLRPSPGNTLRYVRFIGTLEPEFLTLLENRDERALWIYGYWLGLMGRLKAWWCGRHMQRDRMAIRDFLMERAVCHRQNGEGKIWEQLMEDYNSVEDIDPMSLLEPLSPVQLGLESL